MEEEKKVEEKAPQNEIQKELEKHQKKSAYSEQEKVAFNLKRQVEKAKELGIDPAGVVGEKESSDEVPEWYRKEQAKNAQQSAMQLADSITDEDERALTKVYLSSRIVPSGDPQDDFRVAFSAVRALKNKQILEDVSRKSSPRLTASGGSQATKSEDRFEPTPAEAQIMRDFKVSKEKVLEARKKTQARLGQ